MQPDPDPLPPLADVLIERLKAAEQAAKQVEGTYRNALGVQNALTHSYRRGMVAALSDAAALATQSDAAMQRLREALAAKDRAFCTAPLHGLKPEFFAFCELEGEAAEIEFFDTAEDASKAADALLERAEERLRSEGLTEEPEILYGRIYARCETARDLPPVSADYDETWSFELEPRLTAEAENERLRARVAELERKVAQLRGDPSGGPSSIVGRAYHQAVVAELDARLAKFDAIALDAVNLISEPTVNLATCGLTVQKLALLAKEE